MKVEDWLRAVTADAEARGFPELTPLLQALAASTRRLREADGRLRMNLRLKAEATGSPVHQREAMPERER